MKMSEKMDKAIEYMKFRHGVHGQKWISPTEIGENVGGSGYHSTYGSPICKKLVEAGKAERNDKGHYRLI